MEEKPSYERNSDDSDTDSSSTLSDGKKQSNDSPGYQSLSIGGEEYSRTNIDLIKEALAKSIASLSWKVSKNKDDKRDDLIYLQNKIIRALDNKIEECRKTVVQPLLLKFASKANEYRYEDKDTKSFNTFKQVLADRYEDLVYGDKSAVEETDRESMISEASNLFDRKSYSPLEKDQYTAKQIKKITQALDASIGSINGWRYLYKNEKQEGLKNIKKEIMEKLDNPYYTKAEIHELLQQFATKANQYRGSKVEQTSSLRMFKSKLDSSLIDQEKLNVKAGVFCQPSKK